MTEQETLYIEKLEKEIKDLKEQNASQLSMYEMTAVYLKKLQEDLRISEQKLLKTNKKLTDSINYSKHIQDAFIVQIDTLRKTLPNSFIFEKPKDIVSGDFIWSFKNKNIIYLGVGDCTGHGVPGAMLSIFIISMLNQIVNLFEDETPASILEKLDKLITQYLSRYDSAEISIIKYDTSNQKLLFAGAKRPLIHIRNNVLTNYKGSKYILGNDHRRKELVEDIEIEIEKEDMLFMFSDGLQDQFGGDTNTKFSNKRLITLLQDVSNLPINEQYENINSAYDKWKGEYSQIDDIMLLGMRI